MPPLHHEVVTATLRVDETRLPCSRRRRPSRRFCSGLDERYGPTPAGLAITVGWGFPTSAATCPRRRGAPAGRPARVEGRRPRACGRSSTRSASRAIRERRCPRGERRRVLLAQRLAATTSRRGRRALRRARRRFRVTSIRRGLRRAAASTAAQSLPKRMALAAGVPGADLIPDTAELFLGFTSTQKAGLGPAADRELRDARLRRPAARAATSRGGTHMHLSHMFEDLEAWYLNFDFRERVDTTFRPGLDVPEGTQTVPQGPDDVATRERRSRRATSATGAIGHSGVDPAGLAAAPRRRAARRHASTEGHGHPAARRLQHARQPVLLERAARSATAWRDEPAAGLHFVVFNPSSDDFQRNRLAMDGILPDGTSVPFEPRSRAGLQLGAPDDAPAELPRAAAASVPASGR